MTDFARRVADHNFPLDPIVRSLLDTDFYKLLMQQWIWELHPNTVVTFTVRCRTAGVRLADHISEADLRAQLDHARTLSYCSNELIWLRGQSFYGETNIFKPGFLRALERYQLPEYRLAMVDGDYQITFTGPWWQVSPWEVPALAIVSELYSRAMLKPFTAVQLQQTYARAEVRLADKMQRVAGWRDQQSRFRQSYADHCARAREHGQPDPGEGGALYPDINFTDFGTRRRHSFLWQEHCVLTAREIMGPAFTGTSNVLLAYRHGIEARGTNAHELPMVFAALARAAHPEDPQKLVESQYSFLHSWGNYYPQALRLLLPDAYGTSQWLRNAPQEFAWWRGARPDSKAPEAAAEELIQWWLRQGQTPEQVRQKLIIFSDGVDILLDQPRGYGLGDTTRNSPDVIMLHEQFSKRVQVGFGVGTNLTNDFWGCAPPPVTWKSNHLRALSLVCKVTHVNGHPAVKLSDNARKRSGPADEVAHYVGVFGEEGVEDVELVV